MTQIDVPDPYNIYQNSSMRAIQRKFWDFLTAQKQHEIAGNLTCHPPLDDQMACIFLLLQHYIMWALYHRNGKVDGLKSLGSNKFIDIPYKKLLAPYVKTRSEARVNLMSRFLSTVQVLSDYTKEFYRSVTPIPEDRYLKLFRPLFTWDGKKISPGVIRLNDLSLSYIEDLLTYKNSHAAVDGLHFSASTLHLWPEILKPSKHFSLPAFRSNLYFTVGYKYAMEYPRGKFKGIFKYKYSDFNRIGLVDYHTYLEHLGGNSHHNTFNMWLQRCVKAPVEAYGAFTLKAIEINKADRTLTGIIVEIRDIDKIRGEYQPKNKETKKWKKTHS